MSPSLTLQHLLGQRYLFETFEDGNYQKRKLSRQDLDDKPDVTEIEFEIRANATIVTDERVRLWRQG